MTSGIAADVLADPVGLIVGLVGEVEQHLSPQQVRDVVCGVVRARAGRRRLAQTLHEDRSLLRTGRPPAPYSLAKLLMALRQAGHGTFRDPAAATAARNTTGSAADVAGNGVVHRAWISPLSALVAVSYVGSPAETATANRDARIVPTPQAIP
jgi:hypothetical protein